MTSSAATNEKAMPTKDDFQFAIENISRWGDTDVFPFAPENHILYDKSSEVAELLMQAHKDLNNSLDHDPPVNETALQLVTYEGFRWVSQLDPFWNAYLLGLAYSVHAEIESARVGKDKRQVFSYRLDPDPSRKSLFEDNSWASFTERAEELAREHTHVVVTDIADFYGRIYHHRIENALQQLPVDSGLPRIVDLMLRSYSGGVSYGLPVGGPAARILSELALNRVDKLLEMSGVRFVRFADDYRLYADSEHEAFDHLVTLTELLHRHEGLTLQKQKTRVIRSTDFLRSPLFVPEDSEDLTLEEKDERELLRLSLRFDPYSQNAGEEYERLKEALKQFDILEMLSKEVAKSRVNLPVVKRLTQALGFMEKDIQEAAVGTIIDSLAMLSPALPIVLRVIDDLSQQLSEETRATVNDTLRKRIVDGDYYMRLPINRAYALRVLRHEQAEENYNLAAGIFPSSPPFLQRDIVIHMHNWSNADWISEQRRQWTNQHPWVKRALILASYGLKDEGKHWRKSRTFTPFDTVARDWMAERVQNNKMEIPV